jgi:hypothetical protein
MNDFISNLMAKNLGLVVTIQPRLASVFEPPSLSDQPNFKRYSPMEWGREAPSIDTKFNHNMPADEPTKITLEPQTTFSNLEQARIASREDPDKFSIYFSILKSPYTSNSQSLIDYPIRSLSMDDDQPGYAKSSQEKSKKSEGVHPVNSPIRRQQSFMNSHNRISAPQDTTIQNRFDDKMISAEHIRQFIAIDGNAVNPNINKEKEESKPTSIKIRSDPLSNHMNENVLPDIEEDPSQVAVDRITAIEPKLLISSKSPPIHSELNSKMTHTKPGMVIAQPSVNIHHPKDEREIFKPKAQVKAEPNIQVTIGRIEVRAVAQSPSPVKQRWTPHVISLDEYLHSHANGGGR